MFVWFRIRTQTSPSISITSQASRRKARKHKRTTSPLQSCSNPPSLIIAPRLLLSKEKRVKKMKMGPFYLSPFLVVCLLGSGFFLRCATRSNSGNRAIRGPGRGEQGSRQSGRAAPYQRHPYCAGQSCRCRHVATPETFCSQMRFLSALAIPDYPSTTFRTGRRSIWKVRVYFVLRFGFS